MNYIGILLAITFVFSTAGLFAFVWSLSSKTPAGQRQNAEVIFQDVGLVEEPAGTTTQERALQMEMTGAGEITFDGTDSYTGAIKFTSDQMKMTVNLKGRKLGGCDSPQ